MRSSDPIPQVAINRAIPTVAAPEITLPGGDKLSEILAIIGTLNVYAPIAIGLGKMIWGLFHKQSGVDVPDVSDHEMIALMRAPAVRITDRARQWFVDNGLPVPDVPQ